jgi:CelD/BcsL family acetyltransferase involved in cellulose biosynthesis
LEPLWVDLADATGELSPFLSRTWMRSWMDVFGPSLRPEALVWRDSGGALVGCSLLSVVDGRTGPFHVRRAFLSATGERAVASEHNDLLVLPEYRPSVARDLVRHLLSRGVEQLYLAGFRARGAGAILGEWPETAFIGNWSEDPFVNLQSLRDSGKPYLSALSANTRSQVRRSARLYTEMYGGPRLEVARDAPMAREWLGELITMHEARWRARGLSGAFASDDVRRFHGLVIERAFRDPGTLEVDIVRIRFGSTTIGMLYNMKRGGVVSFYQSGFRYEDDNRQKPGLVAHSLAVQQYLETGAREYDFLSGEREPVQYKRSLATGARTLLWAEVPIPSSRMRVIGRLRSLAGGATRVVRRVLRTAGVAAGLLAVASCAPGDRTPSCDLNGDPTALAERPSPYDSLSIRVGDAEAKLCYSRPYARGRAVFGGLVPFDTLWRAGANEATILDVPVPVEVAGIALQPGRYSVYTVPRGEGDWTLVLNASTSQWGLTRDELGPQGVLQPNAYTEGVRAQEVDRAPVSTEPIEYVEQFTARAAAVDGTLSRLMLEWETTRIVVPIRFLGP